MLTALKIIGLVLLGIIGLILLFVLLLVFFPFSYRLSGAKPEEGSPFGKVVISWLFHILHVSFKYDNNGPLLTVRIFGIPVYKDNLDSLLNGTDETDETQSDETNAEETGEVLENSQTEKENGLPEGKEESNPAEEDDIEDLTEEEIERLLKEHDEFDDLPLPKKVKIVLCKIKEFILSIKEKCYNLKSKFNRQLKKIRRTIKLIKHYWKILQHPSVKPGLKHIIKYVIKIVKHVLPRKMRVAMKYGSEDPQATAKFYGYYCMIFPFMGKQISYEPVFDENVFAIKGFIKGRVIIFRVAWLGLRILLNKDVMNLLNIVRREVMRRGRNQK